MNPPATPPPSIPPDIDIDALIARLRAEARALEGTGLAAPAAAPLPRAVDALAPAQRLDGLLAWQGMPFLQQAYQAVLGRDPDADGIAAYLPALRARDERCWVLASLLWSSEARARNARIDGLDWARRLHWLPGKRLLRPLLHWQQSQRCRQPQVLLAGLMQGLQPQIEALQQRCLALEEHAGLSGGYSAAGFGERLQALEAAAEGLREEAARGAQQYADSAHRLACCEQQLRQAMRDFDCSRADLIYHRGQLMTLQARLAATAGGDAGGPPAADPISPTGAAPTEDRAAPGRAAGRADLDLFYAGFEAVFRGDRAAIRADLEHYLPTLRAAGSLTEATPLVDLGCGRGEWLELLQAQGFAARGIDSNPVLVAQCRDLGLTVTEGDALALLQAQPAASLGAVSAFHLAEHLPFPRLFALLQAAFRALRPGAPLLLETPNPENVLVGSHTFYHDPTHRNPLTPNAAAFLLRYLGFSQPEIRRLHPYPASARVPGNDPLTERVNGHLCGPQDFALIALKPACPSAGPSTDETLATAAGAGQHQSAAEAGQ